jgi:hypothetical protein
MRIGWAQRAAMVVAGSVLAGLLITAACLSPSPQGMGTHQQLGLPPCTMVDWFGVRCPSCGMTTSWAHMTKLQVLEAFRANVGGALLALTAAFCGPWLLVSGVRGKWTFTEPREMVVVVIGLAIIVVTLLDWTLRLWN